MWLVYSTVSLKLLVYTAKPPKKLNPLPPNPQTLNLINSVQPNFVFVASIYITFLFILSLGADGDPEPRPADRASRYPDSPLQHPWRRHGSVHQHLPAETHLAGGIPGGVHPSGSEAGP